MPKAMPAPKSINAEAASHTPPRVSVFMRSRFCTTGTAASCVPLDAQLLDRGWRARAGQRRSWALRRGRAYRPGRRRWPAAVLGHDPQRARQGPLATERPRRRRAVATAATENERTTLADGERETEEARVNDDTPLAVSVVAGIASHRHKSGAPDPRMK